MMKRVLIAGAVILVAAALIAAFAFAGAPEPQRIEGEIDATTIDVSSKIAGRVATLDVREGDTVARGTLLATLERDDVLAKLRQAEAARKAADAQRLKADNGARAQEIAQARDNWLRAVAAAEFAETTLARLDRLHADGVVPAQRRDEAAAQAKMARQAEQAAKAGYDMAVEGARSEDRETAAALVERASGAVDEVNAFVKETKLASPISGEVSKTNASAGELVSPGFPVVTITDTSDVWATFNVREDQLASLPVGSTLQARIPALGQATHAFRVYFHAPAGDYATAKPSSAAGGFDVKTFEVRARAVERSLRLRPGMSVIVELAR